MSDDKPAAKPGRRLLPPKVNWAYRPLAVGQDPELIVPNRSVGRGNIGHHHWRGSVERRQRKGGNLSLVARHSAGLERFLFEVRDDLFGIGLFLVSSGD